MLSFAALVALCALQWARMLQPPRTSQMLAVAGVAVLGACALQRARGLRLAPVVAALILSALVASGVAPRLLLPDGWDDIARELARGFGDLPLTNVPYRGTEPATITVLVLIGALLASFAAWLAFAPSRSGARRGPVPAAIVLIVMFGVPAVEAAGDRQWLLGVPLAVALCAFLRLERVERHSARAALVAVLAAGLAAVLVAPKLDATRPLLDYQALARSLTPDRGVTFSWNHSYSALSWPRTGRELLRISAPTASYWKVENLSRFDGLRWVQPREFGQTAQEANIRAGQPEWLSEVHVRVRGLITRLFIGAGTTIRVKDSPRIPIRNAPGTFRTGPRPLRAGHSYDATIWTPRPSRKQLRATGGADVPYWTWQYLRIDLPRAQGGPVLSINRRSALRVPPTPEIAFPVFGESAPPTVEPSRPAFPPKPAGDVLRDSAYGDVYRLALRLQAGTSTPYEYVERVLHHLTEGYSYSEDPPPSRVPLAAFLTRDREGYCQQFSGAMALLLRMGGVPARVSTGFSPGTLDRDRGEYVVRDTDAHSWVEAYLAPFGWVTFDPTPPVGPARLTAVAGDAASPYQLAAPEGVLGVSERVGDRSIDRGQAATGSPVGRITAVVAALGAIAAGVALWIRRRGRRGEAPPVEAALGELLAALARTGRPLSGGLTLQDMLRRYAGTPAEPYLRTLQAARYGGEEAAPTPEMRAALRRELTLGLGPAARLGAWRAIPPVLRRPSRSRSAYPHRR